MLIYTDYGDVLKMYELRLTPQERVAFQTLARIELVRRNMKLNALAKAIGRPKASVYKFFSVYVQDNRFLAAEIADYLGITEERIKEYAEKQFG